MYVCMRIVSSFFFKKKKKYKTFLDIYIYTERLNDCLVSDSILK